MSTRARLARSIVVATAAAAACGRVGFQARVTGDAAPDAAIDAAPPVPMLVAMTGSSTGDSGAVAMLQVTIPAVVPGDLLIVGIAEHHGSTIASVVDGSGRPLVSAGARAGVTGTASDLWYEPAAQTTTSITITPSPASNFDVWIAEYANTRAGAPAAIDMACLQYPPNLVSAPITTTAANELVFSVTMFQAPIYVNAALPPFVGFPPLTGNGAAYLVAQTPGTYATQYPIASGSGMTANTCASSAAWLAGP